MKNLRKKISQELVEFLLVAPFLIIMLGVVTEYAYALNINMTLSQGLKTAATSVYSTIKPGSSAGDIKTKVQTELSNYLVANNAPVKSTNNLTVGYVTKGNITIFMAHYDYIPAFTLPNVYFRIMPNKFTFFTTAAIPSILLGPNSYKNSTDSLSLDKIWGASNFTSPNSYNGSEKGIMAINDNTSGRSKILFLIPTKKTSNLTTVNTLYQFVHWDGTVEDCQYDGNTGYITGTDCKLNYNEGEDQTLFDYITSGTNKYYSIIFIHDANLASATILTDDLYYYWAYKAGGSPTKVDYLTDLSDSSIDGVIKRALSLVDLSSQHSLGNYDNANVNSYNTTVGIEGATSGYSGHNYKMTPFGSIIFMGTDQDTEAIKNIINKHSPISKSYNFNN